MNQSMSDTGKQVTVSGIKAQAVMQKHIVMHIYPDRIHTACIRNVQYAVDKHQLKQLVHAYMMHVSKHERYS